jgi:hypothetical protein
MASMSSMVSSPGVRRPPFIPPPLLLTITLPALNIFSILFSICSSAPEPIERITTSAATPMTMPRLMKKVRSL